MEESAVYLKYSGQGFAHDAIAQALLQSRSPFGHWQSQSLYYPVCLQQRLRYHLH
ncbi:MAG TPA: hypothetical protein V6D43_12380 [Candidatus Sericytochromatia bacterium]